ncbi:hypothetical protein HELRODRAFT_176814 [Helobdella robusta]|uniref:Anaphase-promoting complex subunit 4 WD40 domain-containing protein n=1 Tax=Helobdella robusta TaxID=6412 RepID=T1FAX8_HELRO|nr:hypothetical protein HELRODRAFT_176814 [Helobdella robusta]ESN99643.1 hypothetical protein HELRODRAFT_176814 [Helobdella robusta]
MNYSEVFKLSNGLCSCSYDGCYVANVVNQKLVVRQAASLQVVGLFSCSDVVQYIEWSPDSTMILCAIYKKNLVQVWSIEDLDWTCKVDEGSVGLVGVCWSPDSRHILTTCEFHLRITVWSLVNKSVMYIKYPKQCKNYIDFSSNEKYLAVAERRDCKDYISYFNCYSWDLIKNFPTETENMEGICWSPNDEVLCVWENCLTYKVLIYSLNGSCLSSFSAYDYALGIKSVVWSPSGQFLAIGSYDEKIRLLNHLTWKLILEFPHPPNFDSNIVIYKESVVTDVLKKTFRKYEIAEPNSSSNIQIPTASVNPNSPTPKIGVGNILFSCDSRYLASKSDSMPSSIFIWSLENLKCVAMLLHLQPIKTFSWDPSSPRLIICTGGDEFFIWTPEIALTIPVLGRNDGFCVNDAKWVPCEETSLVLIGKDEMCLGFFQ